ncbi:(deoxy)nucleoside triphosphate pyrophosphohydrolase [Pedobacter sp.]|jgi:8-oxo-dGTP diphosphatase|uniref:(deoxy)nucleoside triphosphate pyrophosphohydrolase n=1 Tax=Pedobacter sp. TaxID=1411316 RepID=UPI002BC09326|nr:(deoxy)nucleoside triphosphate pyrophosphohydrolase [Pedobacter sp.]HWW38529.1 (deoxy)nucleoside triphosphate pyrophosphohydrolase [Pedobacter sp.]
MIDVCCAIIVREDGCVLVAQRAADQLLPLKIEFPGGKVEAGECAEDCLVREIKEELNLDICIHQRMEAHRHRYPDFSICLIPFVCTITGGEIQMNVHQNYNWLKPLELPDQDWAEADVPLMMNYLKSLE